MEEQIISHKDNTQNLNVGYRNKIKNGSKFIIGGELSQVQIIIHQHFNWFQKLMWNRFFGVEVEDYGEE